MSVTSSLPPLFDRLDPAVLDDPYPRYAELRAAGPLARGGPGTWLVTRYAEVSALLSDGRLGNELPALYHEISLGPGPASRFFGRIIFYRDPPVHTRLRQLMAVGFTPRLVQASRPWIETLVDELLAPALERGHLEVVTELAQPLALRVICHLIGIPPGAQDEVLPRAALVARGFAIADDDAQRGAIDAAVVWLQAYIEGLLAERTRRPGQDLLTRMLAARDEGGGLGHRDIVDNCVFLFWAGFETVMSVIGTGTVALMQFPDQFARLRAHPELAGSAVEEFVRYDAPIHGTARIVSRELTIGRQHLRPGRILVLLIGSANRDEAVFAHPDRVDIGRDPNPHLGFGGGAHHCLGNVLARAEAGVVFERLARRFERLEPAGPVERRALPGATMRLHASIPVAVTPTSGGPR
jgi:cytochrome P450